MTAQELFDGLLELGRTADLGKLQIVIRLEDVDEVTTHMGGVSRIAVESGCTDTPALVIDCDQDPANCPMEDDE